MDIIVAEEAGACYGVNRALDTVRQLAGDKPVTTLGPLIHNPRVVKELIESGIGEVDSISELDEGTIVIRSHGVPPQIIRDANAKGLTVVDATCPYVKKVHKRAEQLANEGYQVIILGEAGHPEVEGIRGYAGTSALIIGSPQALDNLELKQRVGIVVQTTQSAEFLTSCLAKIAPRVEEMRVYNTICRATAERQASAGVLATKADVMIVIGGRNSGNTRRLYEICQSVCTNTYHIESTEELDVVDFSQAKSVGITAGASTPQDQVDNVVAYLENM